MAIVSSNGVLLPDGAVQIEQSHYFTLPDGEVVGTLRHVVSHIENIFAAMRGSLHQTAGHMQEKKKLEGSFPRNMERLEAIEQIEISNVRDRNALQSVLRISENAAHAIQVCLSEDPNREFLWNNVPYPTRGQQIATLHRRLDQYIADMPIAKPLTDVRETMALNIKQVTSRVSSRNAQELLGNTYEIASLQQMKMCMEALRGTFIHPGIRTKHELSTMVAAILKPISLPPLYARQNFLFGQSVADFYKKLHSALDIAMNQESLDACLTSVAHILKTHDPLSILPDLIPAQSSLPSHPR